MSKIPKKDFSRRQFCKSSALVAGGLSVGSLPFPILAAQDQDHFFVAFIVNGGWDPTYLFDGRPLTMTKANLIQNYFAKDPAPWKGSNGQSTFATEATRALLPYRDDFSIVNGALMATSFDGHPQNMNYLFTGNPFGGDSFVPWLEDRGAYDRTSIAGISTGQFFADLKNHGGIIPFDAYSGQNLIQNIKTMKPVDLKKDLYKFIQSQYQTAPGAQGSFSLAKKKLESAFASLPSLTSQLTSINIPRGGDNVELATVELLQSLFRKKVARVALLDLSVENRFPDTHDAFTAQEQPSYYTQIAESLARSIKALKETPYDDKRSMLDVTTFMVSSEFSRTMRQNNSPIDMTGTDHNPLTNSFFLGGKKIKGGLVFGQSDYRTEDEVLSPAHLERDPDGIKLMGRSFDFEKMEPIQNDKRAFDLNNYLSMGNITNSLLEAFGVPKQYYRKPDNFSPVSKVLSPLLR